MVQTEKGQEAAQTPTEALASGTDAISEDQKGLDAAADSTPTSQVDAAAERMKYLEGRVNGLQSIVDKQTDFQKRQSDAAQEQQAEQIIGRLPEDQQEYARFQQQQISNLANQQAATPQAPTLDENTMKFVQTYGISPTDPRLDMAGYQEGTAEGTKRFMDSIYAIQNPTQARAPDNTAPQNQQVNPPSVNAAPAEAGTIDSEEALNKAFIEGRVNNTDYIRRRQELGLP